MSDAIELKLKASKILIEELEPAIEKNDFGRMVYWTSQYQIAISEWCAEITYTVSTELIHHPPEATD